MPHILLPHCLSTVQAVGGRWSLVLTTDDDRRGDFILLYDTHNPTTCPQNLIDRSECFDSVRSVEPFQVDIYQPQPHLAFNLCITVAVKGRNWPSFGLIVYSISQSETGKSGKLVPSKVNSFLLPVEGEYSPHTPCAFYGRYYVRAFYPVKTKNEMRCHRERLEIYDWQASNSESHLVATIDLYQDDPVWFLSISLLAQYLTLS